MKRMVRLLILSVALAIGSGHSMVAQWVQTSGAGSANVTNFAVSGSDLFAGFNAGYNSGGVILSRKADPYLLFDKIWLMPPNCQVR